MGTIALVYRFPELITQHGQGVLIELTELLATISGTFMLRAAQLGKLACAGLDAFHVSISFLVVRQVASHMII